MAFCSVPLVSQEAVDKYVLLDSAVKVLKMQNPKGWSITRHGSRVVMTRSDSILVATSYSDYKPGKPLTEFTAVKYKYQLFIDFHEPDLNFTGDLRRLVNDSISRLISRFNKKNYGKGEYYIHLEAIELLEKMKLKEPVHLNHFDIVFSDNCADDWIPYEQKDIEHLPFEPPTRFQRSLSDLKARICGWFKEWGI